MPFARLFQCIRKLVHRTRWRLLFKSWMVRLEKRLFSLHSFKLFSSIVFVCWIVYSHPTAPDYICSSSPSQQPQNTKLNIDTLLDVIFITLTVLLRICIMWNLSNGWQIISWALALGVLEKPLASDMGKSMYQPLQHWSGTSSPGSTSTIKFHRGIADNR